MTYTASEKQALNDLARTDFKALKKDEFMKVYSMLEALRPEVAMEAVKQFPELAKYIQTSLNEYKSILDKIVSSNNDSTQRFYDLSGKVINVNASNSDSYFKLLETTQEAFSRYYDSATTPEERAEIRHDQMEICKMADSKEQEIRQYNEKILNEFERKESENRQNNWKLIKLSSAVLISAIGVGFIILGGKADFRLTTNKV